MSKVVRMGTIKEGPKIPEESESHFPVDVNIGNSGDAGISDADIDEPGEVHEEIDKIITRIKKYK